MSEWALSAFQALMSRPWKTRFAPSPTGYLHYGHVLHAMWVWGVRELSGGTVALRLEDHDRVRCRPEYSEALLEGLQWLGLVPDTGLLPDGSADSAAVQSAHPERYARALEDWKERGGGVYGCACSRADIRNRRGGSGGDVAYDGHCRNSGLGGPSLRVVIPDREIALPDLHAGVIRENPARLYGDLRVSDAPGQWTYQWCVVVDDADQGIDLIIRGEDLIDSCGRQAILRETLFGLPPILTFHHPLLYRSPGVKLSKSTGSEGVKRAGARAWSGTLFPRGERRTGASNRPGAL